jgi:uncharacterized cupin superfamily protein
MRPATAVFGSPRYSVQAGDIHGAAAGSAHTTMNLQRSGLVATYSHVPLPVD